MPVTNPSYFPPSKPTGRIVGITAGQQQLGNNVFLAGDNAGRFTTQSDLYIIGQNALAGASADASLSGTLVIGSNGLNALVNSNIVTNGTPGPLTAIGNGVAQLITQKLGSCVLIGDEVLGSAVTSGGSGDTEISNSVLLGPQAGQFAGSTSGGNSQCIFNSVILGFRAARSSAGRLNAIKECLVIGAQAAESTGSIGGGDTISQSTIIGTRAGRAAGAGGTKFQMNVLLGWECGLNLDNAYNNVLLGTSANAAAGIHTVTSVGHGPTGIASPTMTIVGGNIDASNVGPRSVLIGANCALGLGSPENAVFAVMATDDGGANGGILLRGNFDTGVFGIGKPTGSPLQGTNTLRLYPGTKGVGSPSAGGFFYYDVATGLRFLGAGGTDTLIAPP